MDASPYAVLARVYDLQHHLLTADLQMYERLARDLAPDQPVLEIGSGTGRVLIPLVQAGLDVVGIDNSPEMVAIARQRLATTPASSPSTALKAELVLADALTYVAERRFGLAFVALNTFLHNLSQAAQLQTLRAARANLAEGGYLVVDLPPNDELANQPDDGEFEFEASIIEPGTGTQIEKFVASRVYWATQEQELTYRMLERDARPERGDGTSKRGANAQPLKTTEVTFRLRHIFKHEMELLLMQTGFAAPRWYGDYDLSDYTDDSPRMIAVAQVAA